MQRVFKKLLKTQTPMSLATFLSGELLPLAEIINNNNNIFLNKY